MMNKLTLVIGASENEERYSNKAIRKLRAHHHEVYAIGLKQGQVLDVPIEKEWAQYKHIDTITLYIGSQHQATYIPYLLSLQPKRLIFNPGTENVVFFEQAIAAGIHCLEACTLVMLSTNQY